MSEPTENDISDSISPLSGSSEPKPRRAAHTKSRQGCFKCKKRRVKCTEERPRCKACRLRGESCRYPEPIACPSCRRLECACVGDPTGAAIPSPADSAAVFELTYHYGRYTYDTIFVEPMNIKAKQYLQAPGCLDYPFMMDILLALSAAHLATLKPDKAEEYAYNAVKYQNRGLAQFHEVLQDLTADKCLPVFTFSALIGLLHMALSRIWCTDEHKQSPVDLLCQLANLWRGSGSILDQSRILLPNGDYEEAFEDEGVRRRRRHLNGPERDLPSLPLAEPLESILSQLEDDFDVPPLPGMLRNQNKIVQHVIRELRIVTTVHGTSLPIVFLSWPTVIPPEFYSLAQDGHPGALTVMACWGYLSLRINDRWYFRGFGVDLLRDIVSTVDHPVYSPMHRRLLELATTTSTQGDRMSQSPTADNMPGEALQA